MKKALLIILAIVAAIQLIRPDRSNPPVDPKRALQAPEEVMTILKRSCYDCHSNQTRWPWYSQIAPMSWSIANHVREGRKALNFSNWQSIDPDIKRKRLERAIKTTQNGMMPLPSYLWLHEDARLSKEEKKRLKAWFSTELEKLNP